MYYGCKKETTDKRDYKMKKVKTYHDTVDGYEISMPDVKDQGIVNSCVAHSLALLLETLNTETKFSTGFIYGYRPIGYSQDDGMYPREALKTITKIGDVPNYKFDHNKEMPEIKQYVDRELKELKPLADVYRIHSYSRIYTIDEIKQCLLNDTVVPISIPVYNDLQYEKKNYIIQEPSGNLCGYHMIVIYGFNKNGWLIQNSWGKEWADNGRAILSFDYPIDSAWAISTDENDIYNYQTIWQKIKNLLKTILNIFK